MYLYGWMLYNDNDKEKAASYFKRSADMDNVFSMYLYGKMLSEGDGVKRNKKETALFFKNAADNGYYLSMYQYGKMLLNGIGVNKNKTEAYKYIHNSFSGTTDLHFSYTRYRIQ